MTARLHPFNLHVPQCPETPTVMLGRCLPRPRRLQPMVHDSRLPLWLVPCVSLLLPAAFILGAHLAGRASRREAHHACLMLFFSVALTGLVCNLLKSQVSVSNSWVLHL